MTESEELIFLAMQLARGTRSTSATHTSANRVKVRDELTLFLFGLKFLHPWHEDGVQFGRHSPVRPHEHIILHQCCNSKEVRIHCDILMVLVRAVASGYLR